MRIDSGCGPFVTSPPRSRAAHILFVDEHAGAVQTVENTIAHEVGHALNLEHPEDSGDPDPENLMNVDEDNPERLRKLQWDTLHLPPGP